jgi:hypothetical protein
VEMSEEELKPRTDSLLLMLEARFMVESQVMERRLEMSLFFERLLRKQLGILERKVFNYRLFLHLFWLAFGIVMLITLLTQEVWVGDVCLSCWGKP